jgi:hypothetical protein
MASIISAECLRTLSEWKTAHAVLADAVRIYLDACLRLEVSCAKVSGLVEKNVEGIRSVYSTLDDAITILVSHEDSLRNARAHLERRQDTLDIFLPIRKLPPDLLSQIFTLAVESSRPIDARVRPPQPLDMTNVLASVCSHWRHVAISTGTLWAYIDLSRLGAFEHAATCILRAKGCLLDIRAVTKSTSNDQHDPLAEPVPKQNHKTGSLLNLIHPVRVRSILLHAEKPLVDSWFSWWFEHGAPGTVTTLAVSSVGERALFPMTPKETPQDRMDELLRSVDTLYLSELGLYWDSLRFHDLTILHLAWLDIPMRHFVQILLASPRIQCLQLSCVGLIDHEAIALQPIQLNHLEILELSVLTNEDLIPIFDMLMPGTGGLTFKFEWAFTDHEVTEHVLATFFQHAKVTKFHSIGRKLPQDLTAMSDLEVLVLENITIDGSMCDIISPRSDMDQQPLPTPLFQLHTIETLGCYFEDISGFKRILAVCPIRTLRISADCQINHTDQPGDEGFESWAGPGVEFETVFQKDVVGLGYLPFGDC